MSQLTYTLYAIFYVGFSIYGYVVWRRTGRLSTLIVWLVALALIYDNGVIALGNLVGEGEFLRILTVGRFCIHFTVTPLLIWTSLEQARRAGYAWAGGSAVRMGTMLLIVGLVVTGFVTEVHNIDLELMTVDGVLRYMLPEAIFTAIVPVIGAVIALVIGGLVWRARGWPWMLFGTLVIFLSEGALRGSENVVLLVVQNGAEILYMLAYLQTEVYLHGSEENS
jgi:hypothetical protein